MKIHEYQAKEILRKYGVPVPGGEMAITLEEADTASKSLFGAGNKVVVVKAQIHAGGRGKGGGVKLARTLESGIPLEQALKTHESSIPPHLRGLVIAGMRSGEMGDLLGRFSDYVSIGAELKRKLWLSLAYPALTVGVALALFILVCLVVVNQFETIYKDFNIPLPRATLSIMRKIFRPFLRL